MISKRHLLASLILVIAACANSFASGSQQPHAAFNPTIKDGVLKISTPDGDIFTDMKLRLRLGDGSSLIGELQPAGQDRGDDKAGKYVLSRYRLVLNAQSQRLAQASTTEAVLEVRHYDNPRVIVASLDYKGAPLAATDGVQLLMRLDSYARGMALKRFKLYWTAPVFTSDYRFLPTANQLLLWRRAQTEKFHLLVPLAGDGMIAELGVADIDYRYEFRVSASSNAPDHTPGRIPLFAYAASDDPYRLARETYATAFAASNNYGRLRWEKGYPEIFRSLGWCSWNTYYKEVTEEKIINSVRSLRDKNIPVGFILIDDGWLNIKENKLSDFEADPRKFPGGLARIARTLRDEYKIPHVGVWHTFQGYWDGINKDSAIGKQHKLFTGIDGKALPDPRDGAGEDFYRDWYKRLNEWGYDFTKIDNQSSNAKFTNGFLPLLDSGGGTQRNLQEGARKSFKPVGGVISGVAPSSLNIINCMEMTLENAYNWRHTNLARNSDDYLPEDPQNAKDHIFQNAYNTFWTSNFAYPDWDMFQTHDPNAETHIVARAISGGPVYFTDEPGKENAELLRRLAFSDARLLMLDEPGQVTRDLLLTDTALEAVPLKIAGRITRRGYSAGMLAAFNVNKSAPVVTGNINFADIEGMKDAGGKLPTRIAVYERGTERVTLLDARNSKLPLRLTGFRSELFTLVPVDRGIAVFGLLDKYIGAAGVESLRFERGRVAVVDLREAGDFGAWLAAAPAGIEVGGRPLESADYNYERGLLRIPRARFGNATGAQVVRIRFASARQ